MAKQYRQKAGTRSWAQAEEQKRRLEGQLSGRVPDQAMDDPHFIEDAVENFTKLKRVEGVAASVLGKYTRELARFKTFCAQKGIYAMQGITADVLTDFCDTWPQLYPSTYSRAKVR
jgi:spore coat polysaccharide biosynthesis protein SpsF (cytidylyltransferase family)